MGSNNVFEYDQTLDEAFPRVDPGVQPLGTRVLVQLRTVKQKSKGGIVLVEEAKDVEKWNTQVGRVYALGPLAFRNRNSGEAWPEGSWAEPGSFVRVPRWGGDRLEVPVEGQEECALFVMFQDHELIAKVTGDPRKQRAYIL